MFAIHFILSFIAGVLICNCIPHLTAGLRGEPFPTLFSVPRGIAPSAPEINALWGAGNLFVGLALFRHDWIGFGLGFVLFAWYISKHFGRVRAAAGERG